jgi:O-antigen/teichoic acid export membrane protein
MTGRGPPEEAVPVTPLPHGEFDEPLDGASNPAFDAVAAGEARGPRFDLKRKTAKSILWTIVRTGSDYLFSFVVFAVLARKLGPAEFGVFALAVAFAEFGKILPTAGLVNALSRARQVSAEMADTVFWATLGLSCLVAVMTALVARPVAAAVGAPAVAPLLTALAMILPVTAAGATHITLKLRNFGHKSMASRSVVSGVLGGAAALTAAYAGWGAWSLVVQRAVTEVAGTAMAWQAYRWVPGRRYSAGILRDLAGFSASMTVTSFLFIALVRVQDLIIGRLIGTAAVGVYRTAWRTVDLISVGVILPFSQVSLPALTRLQDDLPAFRKAYLRILAVSSALAFPAIIGFAVLAPYAIPLIFGEQWTESAEIAQVLGFMAVPFTLNRFAGPTLATLGRSGTLAKIAGLQVALTVAMTVAAAPFGLTAIAAAYVLRAYLLLPVQMLALKRYSGLGYGATLGAIAPALLTAMLMAAVLLSLNHLVGGRFQHRGIYLIFMVCTGAAVYGAALLLFARRFVLEQIRDIKRLLPREPATLSGAGA